MGPIIDGNDFDTWGKARLDLPEFFLDPVDHLQGVLSLTHDYNAGDDIPQAVQIDHAPA